MTREKARELCSEHHSTEWDSRTSGDLTKLRIGIPQVCVLAALTTYHHSMTYYSGVLGILSDFARQLYRITLPPRGPRPQGPRRDRAPRFPPKHPLRPQRILRPCERRGKQ
jgi:hypothetical protein